MTDWYINGILSLETIDKKKYFDEIGYHFTLLNGLFFFRKGKDCRNVLVRKIVWEWALSSEKRQLGLGGFA